MVYSLEHVKQHILWKKAEILQSRVDELERENSLLEYHNEEKSTQEQGLYRWSRVLYWGSSYPIRLQNDSAATYHNNISAMIVKLLPTFLCDFFFSSTCFRFGLKFYI